MIAFTKGWQLSLVLLACIPCIVIVGGVMSLMMAKMSSLGQTAYAEAGNVVEQTLGAIRTVRHTNQLLMTLNELLLYVTVVLIFFLIFN